MNFTKEQTEAARMFQHLLVRNGAMCLHQDDTLIDSDSENNVFNYDE